MGKIQGEIFEDSVDLGLDSLKFIELFMNGHTAYHLDLPMHRLTLSSKERIAEEFYREATVPLGDTWLRTRIYWVGYVYRVWHYCTGEFSRDIYRRAGPHEMWMYFPKLCGAPSRIAVEQILLDLSYKGL